MLPRAFSMTDYPWLSATRESNRSSAEGWASLSRLLSALRQSCRTTLFQARPIHDAASILPGRCACHSFPYGPLVTAVAHPTVGPTRLGIPGGNAAFRRWCWRGGKRSSRGECSRLMEPHGRQPAIALHCPRWTLSRDISRSTRELRAKLVVEEEHIHQACGRRLIHRRVSIPLHFPAIVLQPSHCQVRGGMSSISRLGVTSHVP
jgi:hypothetical protein